MVVYIRLEIIRVGPPQKKKKKRLRAYTQIKEKKTWAQAWELEPIFLTDWNFFEKGFWSISLGFALPDSTDPRAVEQDTCAT